ncbi:MAG: RloB family protein [Lautropia sp.]|nr:RloB family protein [Lautropia sp.]
MGRDNSPRERQRRHLERKTNSRAGHDRILIVSEGARTEPNYFNEIRAVFRLHTASVQVHHSELGTAPIHVVKYAERLFNNGHPHKGIQKRAFEQVYVVFDRDEHQSYSDALNKAESLDGKLRNDLKSPVKFRAIASVPCFELWLLLHFEAISAPLHRSDVFRRLKRHLPEYEKGAADIFGRTQEMLDSAFGRARGLPKEARFTAEGPYTDVHELVEVLIGLKKTPS